MSLFNFFKKNPAPAPDPQADAVLSSLAKNEILMETDDAPSDPSASRIGGAPCLPAGFDWPLFTDTDEDVTRPLSFLCQINLAEVHDLDRDGLLPTHGMLSFFYDYEAFRWGFDPEDRGCARVFYFEDLRDLVPTTPPAELSEEYTVPEMGVRFTSRDSFPCFEEFDLHANLSCDWEDYDALLESKGISTEEEVHKLLGYAYVIQNEMLTECERVSRGLYCGDAESYESTSEEDEESIRHRATDWTLLLQLTTLEKDGWEMMWGDCGMLYFYIRKEDLAAGRFENAWFALQCG